MGFSFCPPLLQLLPMVLLILEVITLAMLIMMVLTAMTRRTTSATRNPSNKNMKNAMLTDIIVDVTYIEECEYVVITHCNEEHEQAYHNSHIVKGESEVVDAHHESYEGDYHKRSANPGDHGYSSGP